MKKVMIDGISVPENPNMRVLYFLLGAQSHTVSLLARAFLFMLIIASVLCLPALFTGGDFIAKMIDLSISWWRGGIVIYIVLSFMDLCNTILFCSVLMGLFDKRAHARFVTAAIQLERVEACNRVLFCTWWKKRFLLCLMPFAFIYDIIVRIVMFIKGVRK